jgi:hypothetical protein
MGINEYEEMKYYTHFDYIPIHKSDLIKLNPFILEEKVWDYQLDNFVCKRLYKNDEIISMLTADISEMDGCDYYTKYKNIKILN